MSWRLSSDPDKRWAVEVGRFILAFGDIEHTSIACLAGIPTDPIGKVSTTMALGLRLELLAAILEGREQPEYQTLFKALKRVQKFLTNRNLVAHNPVQFSFYQKNDKSEVLIQTELVSYRDSNKRLTYDQMIRLADQAEELSEAFGSAAMAVFEAYHVPDE